MDERLETWEGKPGEAGLEEQKQDLSGMFHSELEGQLMFLQMPSRLPLVSKDADAAKGRVRLTGVQPGHVGKVRPPFPSPCAHAHAP